jgi:hypothetical protein
LSRGRGYVILRRRRKISESSFERSLVGKVAKASARHARACRGHPRRRALNHFCTYNRPFMQESVAVLQSNLMLDDVDARDKREHDGEGAAHRLSA